MQRTTYFLDVENGEAIFEVRDVTAGVDQQEAIRFGEVWRDWDQPTKLFNATIEPWPYARFPLRYPSLVFALAGVGVLCFRRQFSIRSAMIVTAIVAALIGMVIVL